MNKCLVLIIFISVLPGCAAFHNSPILGVESKAPQFYEGKIVQADYDVVTTINGEKKAATDAYEKAIKEVFSDASIFTSFEPGRGTEAYHLAFRPNGVLNLTNWTIATTITMVSLGLIPTTWSAQYELTVIVTKNGILVKNYEYKTTTRLWFHLGMLLLMKSHGSEKTDNEIMRSLLKRVVADMRVDGLV